MYFIRLLCLLPFLLFLCWLLFIYGWVVTENPILLEKYYVVFVQVFVCCLWAIRALWARVDGGCWGFVYCRSTVHGSYCILHLVEWVPFLYLVSLDRRLRRGWWLLVGCMLQKGSVVHWPHCLRHWIKWVLFYFWWRDSLDRRLRWVWWLLGVICCTKECCL